MTAVTSRTGLIKAAFDGATNRLLSDKLAERISFRDFGAVGDGAVSGAAATGTDDTAAITAAIAYAASVNRPVYGEGLTYRHDSTIALPSSGATWIEDATFVAGAYIGNAFDCSSEGPLTNFGFLRFNYIDPRIDASLSNWVITFFNAGANVSALPPINFFIEQCDLVVGSFYGVRYTCPDDDTERRSFRLTDSWLRGAVISPTSVGVALNYNDAPNKIFYTEANFHVSHFRSGLLIIGATSANVWGGSVVDCAASFARYFGREKTTNDPNNLDSLVVIGKKFDASAGIYEADPETDNGQKLLVFGLYAKPITAIGNQLHGHRTKTWQGISPDTERNVLDADGNQGEESRDNIIGNTIKNCQFGIKNNSHPLFSYSMNNISLCDTGIYTHHGVQPSRKAQIAHNILDRCDIGIFIEERFSGADGAYNRNQIIDVLIKDNIFNECPIEFSSPMEGAINSIEAKRLVTTATDLINAGARDIFVTSATDKMAIVLPFARRTALGQSIRFFHNASTESFAIKSRRLSFDDSDVTVADDYISVSEGGEPYQDFATGDRVVLQSAGTLPGGLVAGQLYYLVLNPRDVPFEQGQGGPGLDEIGFSTTLANALADPPVLVTITGVTGSQTGHLVGDAYYDLTGAAQTAADDVDEVATTVRLAEVVSVPGGWQRIR